MKDRPLVRLLTPNKISEYLEKIKQINPLITYQNKSNINDNDPQNTYNEFDSNLQKLLNKYFPLVKQSRKQFKEKPFITSGIKESIKSRNLLFKAYQNNRTEINETNWKNKRNMVVEILRIAEAKHNASFIKNHGDNSRQLWKRFGDVLSKSKTNNSPIDKLVSHNQTITNPNEITSEFNKDFISLGEKLAKNIKNCGNNQFKKYLGDPSNVALLLKKITRDEIRQEIKQLKSNKSPGHDEFTIKFIKISQDIIVDSLSEIFNLSIKKGVYPDKLKIAKVIPIFKKGDPKITSNFRPISVLSCINKLFEKLISKRIYEFLEQHKILYEFQYGFRQGHSTTHALTEIVDKIKLGIDKNEITCGIFLDLSKAFDTVNHDILLHKLHHYGIQGPAHKLLKSYLTNRKQYVKIGNQASKFGNITCGVPQGSVLGPLLFILYINDLHKACLTGNIRIFADDTNIFFKCKNNSEITQIGNTIMSSLQTWFQNNKLSLNSEKSCFIVFRSKRKKLGDIPNEINFNHQSIKRSKTVKYLGVILDENLTWNEHISDVCNKLKRYFKIFYHLRRNINIEQVKVTYYALIYSKIKYGITVYGFANKDKINRIQILQNKLLKVLLSKNYRYPTSDLHLELGILKVQDIIEVETATFMHNYFSNKLPTMFNKYFTLFGEVTDIQTRGSNNQIIVDKHKTNMGESSIKISGAKIWNKISTSNKQIKNVKVFRKKIKSKILPTYL